MATNNQALIQALMILVLLVLILVLTILAILVLNKVLIQVRQVLNRALKTQVLQVLLIQSSSNEPKSDTSESISYSHFLEFSVRVEHE